MQRSGIIRNKEPTVIPVCAVAFISNLLLFFVKLYVGLGANSISIYSDGVNNMFDSLSALLTLVCFYLLGKSTAIGSGELLKKSEHLISCVLSASVLFSGAYFAYNSAERLMYPTPVWFSMKYFYIVASTAVAKLLMLVIYKKMNKKIGSSAVKVMTYDCVLDFFITAVTLTSFGISATGFFASDGICGIIISIIIITGAAKILKENICKVTGFVPTDIREQIEEIFLKADIDPTMIEARFERDDTLYCYAVYKDAETTEKAEKLYSEIKKITSVTMKTVKETENNG